MIGDLAIFFEAKQGGRCLLLGHGEDPLDDARFVSFVVFEPVEVAPGGRLGHEDRLRLPGRLLELADPLPAEPVQHELRDEVVAFRVRLRPLG